MDSHNNNCIKCVNVIQKNSSELVRIKTRLLIFIKSLVPNIPKLLNEIIDTYRVIDILVYKILNEKIEFDDIIPEIYKMLKELEKYENFDYSDHINCIYIFNEAIIKMVENSESKDMFILVEILSRFIFRLIGMWPHKNIIGKFMVIFNLINLTFNINDEVLIREVLTIIYINSSLFYKTKCFNNCKDNKKNGKDIKLCHNTVLLCANCKYSRYCSVKCQKDNWKQHKKYCTTYGIIVSSLEFIL